MLEIIIIYSSFPFRDFLDNLPYENVGFSSVLSVLVDFVFEPLLEGIELISDPSSLLFVGHLPIFWDKRGSDNVL